jgi:hypothetical protein
MEVGCFAASRVIRGVEMQPVADPMFLAGFPRRTRSCHVAETHTNLLYLLSLIIWRKISGNGAVRCTFGSPLFLFNCSSLRVINLGERYKLYS